MTQFYTASREVLIDWKNNLRNGQVYLPFDIPSAVIGYTLTDSVLGAIASGLGVAATINFSKDVYRKISIPRI